MLHKRIFVYLHAFVKNTCKKGSVDLHLFFVIFVVVAFYLFYRDFLYFKFFFLFLVLYKIHINNQTSVTHNLKNKN